MSTDGTAAAEKPRLLYFFDGKDGYSRRVDGFIAQVLQHRRNHETFQIHRIDVRAHPELAERFRVERTPTICVVDQRRLAVRAYRPRGAGEIQQLLAPWLR